MKIRFCEWGSWRAAKSAVLASDWKSEEVGCPNRRYDPTWAEQQCKVLSHQWGSRVAEAQPDRQHAAGRPAEAEAVAGGADPVWEVPRCQLAGPGRTCASSSPLSSFDANTNAGGCSVEQHGLISLPLQRCSVSFYFTVGSDLPNPLETCSSSRLEYRPGCYTLQKLGHTHR